VSSDVDITDTFKAIVDIASVKTGWMNFDTGGAPDKRFIPSGVDRGAAPSDKFKWGAEILLKLSKECGGDVRSLSSNSFMVVKSLSELHDAFLIGARENQGRLPVVTLETSLPQKGAHGTNYKPVFKIVGWAARPSDLPGGDGATVAPVKTAAPSTGSTPVGAPAAKAKQPEMADDDFG
jgi:hypothetical protein